MTPKRKAETIFMRHMDVLDKQGNSVNKYVKKGLAIEASKITINEMIMHSDGVYKEWLQETKFELEKL